MDRGRDDQGRSLRILHVFRAPLGGLFRHVIDLAAKQVARGHEVGLFFDSRMRGEGVASALARVGDGFALGVHTCPIGRYPSLGDAGVLAKIVATLNKIVHGHGFKGGLFARFPFFLGVARGAARAYTPHGGSFNYRPGAPSHRLYMATEKALTLATDVFLFESAFIAARFDEYVGSPGALRRIVANGIGPAEFAPASPAPDAADLLYIGELRAAKGIDTLIAAIALARRSCERPLTLALVGSGPDEASLRTLARSSGLYEHISFLGPMAAREAFRRGRIMVAPSRAESLPYVILEAAGARVPTVATDVGGIPEIFGPYRCRLGPCDDPTDLCARIVAMIKLDEAERRRQSDELAAYVAEKFSIEAMVDQVMDGYREALDRRAGRARRASAATPIEVPSLT